MSTQILGRIWVENSGISDSAQILVRFSSDIVENFRSILLCVCLNPVFIKWIPLLRSTFKGIFEIY